MLFKLRFGALFLASSCVWGQQAVHRAPTAAPAKSATSTLPTTSPELAKVILGSYYHPDNLELMDCDLDVDWDAFLGAFSRKVPEARMRQMKGLTIHARAVRRRPLEVHFDWTDGAPETQEQIETGLKQMLGGFCQMYWPMMARPLLGKDDRLEQIASLPDGGAKASTSSGGTKVHFVVNREGAPTHYDFDSGMIKGLVDLTYVPSPKPAPGDLRRIEGMKVEEQIGTSSLKFDVKVDYQDADGFSIPQDVSFSMLGAYNFNFKFSECKVSTVAVSQ